MATEKFSCRAEHFALLITVNEVPLPIIEDAEGQLYVESNLSTPVSYKVETEDWIHGERESQSWPVTPYQLVIQRFSDPAMTCYFDIRIDGVKVKSCTIEPCISRKISGFKDKGLVKEFLFSLPRWSKSNSDKVSEDRQSKVGLIEVECYEARYMTDSYHDRKRLDYTQASKQDVRHVTGGQYTMSTTKVGRVLYSKDATRRVHVWRKVRLLSSVTVRYRMGHTLREMGLNVPDYPYIPKTPRGQTVRPFVLRISGHGDSADNTEPVNIKRERSPEIIDLTGDDSMDSNNDIQYLGTKKMKTETVDLTEAHVMTSSRRDVADDVSEESGDVFAALEKQNEEEDGKEMCSRGSGESGDEDDENEDDEDEVVVVYDKKPTTPEPVVLDESDDDRNINETRRTKGAPNSVVTQSSAAPTASTSRDTGTRANKLTIPITGEDVFDLLDLDFVVGEEAQASGVLKGDETDPTEDNKSTSPVPEPDSVVQIDDSGAKDNVNQDEVQAEEVTDDTLQEVTPETEKQRDDVITDNVNTADDVDKDVGNNVSEDVLPCVIANVGTVSENDVGDETALVEGTAMDVVEDDADLAPETISEKLNEKDGVEHMDTTPAVEDHDEATKTDVTKSVEVDVSNDVQDMDADSNDVGNNDAIKTTGLDDELDLSKDNNDVIQDASAPNPNDATGEELSISSTRADLSAPEKGGEILPSQAATETSLSADCLTKTVTTVTDSAKDANETLVASGNKGLTDAVEDEDSLLESNDVDLNIGKLADQNESQESLLLE